MPEDERETAEVESRSNVGELGLDNGESSNSDAVESEVDTPSIGDRLRAAARESINPEALTELIIQSQALPQMN